MLDIPSLFWIFSSSYLGTLMWFSDLARFKILWTFFSFLMMILLCLCLRFVFCWFTDSLSKKNDVMKVNMRKKLTNCIWYWIATKYRTNLAWNSSIREITFFPLIKWRQLSFNFNSTVNDSTHVWVLLSLFTAQNLQLHKKKEADTVTFLGNLCKLLEFLFHRTTVNSCFLYKH